MSEIAKILSVSEEEKKGIRKFYNKSEEDVRKDVEILLEWLDKQPHLPGPFDVVRLENFLLRNKFRIERTKTKLDKYYTYKGMYPKYFENADVDSDAIRNSLKCVIWVPVPKLLPTFERLMVLSFVDDAVSLYNVHHTIYLMVIYLEIALSHEYALSDRILFDFDCLTFKHIAKMDPIALASGYHIHQEVFPGRISFIEIINLAPTMDIMITLIKRIFSAKLFKKVRIHKDLDSLYAVLPKEYLPVEYGGNQESIHEIHAKLCNEYKYQREFVLETTKKVSNEKLRMGKSPYNDEFGVDGTFKVLNLD